MDYTILGMREVVNILKNNTNYISDGIDARIKGFRVVETFNNDTGYNQILIHDVADLSPFGFDLKGTFESGQCFRWREVGGNRYFGIVKGKAVTVWTVDNKHLQIENATMEDFVEIWHAYFDLSTDYGPIIEAVDKDPFLHASVMFSGGARMLCQDFEETLFSYILSAQNNIPRIKKLVETLCANFGDKIYRDSDIGKGSDIGSVKNSNIFDVAGDKSLEFQPPELLGYSFPSAEILSRHFCTRTHANCCSKNLCGHQFAGYRCPYIRGTAQMLSNDTVALDFDLLGNNSAKVARKELCRFPGVGEKVADCVLLYSGIRKDICPIDTWVEKTIKSNYVGPDASKNEIRAFSENYFGRYAGYAQLWFFNYARNFEK